jgi:hypothetical protein
VPALIPVYTQYGITEMADAARVRQLRGAPNAQFVTRHKDGRIMRINLTSYGDDYGRRARASNPQKDVHHAETETNPAGVWTFKHQCGRAQA